MKQFFCPILVMTIFSSCLVVSNSSEKEKEVDLASALSEDIHLVHDISAYTDGSLVNVNVEIPLGTLEKRLT